MLNTRNDLIHSILNVWRHVSGKIALGVAARGDGGVASEGRVVGVPKFHSWGKCTMPLTDINSDWISNVSSGLCIIYLRGSFKLHLEIVCCTVYVECTSKCF